MDIELAGASPVSIAWISMHGECTFANQQWALMAGREPQEVLGHEWLEAVHPDDRIHFYAEI
ncbi:MAG TPA: PAS domain-containing protein, partial [Limnobacter sp.]|nr:PAS domain-containing protein [Limnobacter sp.]